MTRDLRRVLAFYILVTVIALGIATCAATGFSSESRREALIAHWLGKAGETEFNARAAKLNNESEKSEKVKLATLSELLASEQANNSNAEAMWDSGSMNLRNLMVDTMVSFYDEAITSSTLVLQELETRRSMLRIEE